MMKYVLIEKFNRRETKRLLHTHRYAITDLIKQRDLFVVFKISCDKEKRNFPKIFHLHINTFAKYDDTLFK